MEFVRRNLLEDSESDSEPEHRLTINEHYAKAFAFRKEREELSKRSYLIIANFSLQKWLSKPYFSEGKVWV